MGTMILPGGPGFVHQCSVRVKPSTHVRMYSCLPLPPLPPQPDSSVTLSCKRREGPQASGSTAPALPGAKVSTVAVGGRQSPEHGRGRGHPASARSSGLPFDRSFAFCCFHESWTGPRRDANSRGRRRLQAWVMARGSLVTRTCSLSGEDLLCSKHSSLPQSLICG